MAKAGCQHRASGPAESPIKRRGNRRESVSVVARRDVVPDGEVRRLRFQRLAGYLIACIMAIAARSEETAPQMDAETRRHGDTEIPSRD